MNQKTPVSIHQYRVYMSTQCIFRVILEGIEPITTAGLMHGCKDKKHAAVWKSEA